MKRNDEKAEELATPGAGPSTLARAQGRSAEPVVAARREELLRARRLELAQILDRHDDLIREAFHLEKFTTLVSYNPKVAKEDRSEVFEQYRSKYDLLGNVQTGPGSARKTRGAAQSQRDLFTTQVGPSPSRSSVMTSPTKGKGKMPIPAASNSPTKLPSSSALSSKAGPRAPRFASAIGNRAPTTGASRKILYPPPSPISPTRIKLIRPQSSTKQASAAPTEEPTRTTIRLTRRPRIDTDNPQTTSSRRVFGVKNKATSPPPEPPRIIKRIKLIHRPRLEYSDPTQIPPLPLFRYSLPSLLNSYVFTDEDTTLSGDDLAQLDALAQAEAQKRKRIDELRSSGAFEIHENKVDITPPDEPKRPPGFQDHLVAQVVQLSKVFRENGKAKVAGARRIAKMIEKHFELVAGADAREQKAEERRRAHTVKMLTKDLVKQWSLAVKVVRSRKKELERAEQMRRGKEHLDAFLQQSSQVLEAQHTELAAGFSKNRSTSRSSRSSTGWRSASQASRSRSRTKSPFHWSQNDEDEEANIEVSGRPMSEPDDDVFLDHSNGNLTDTDEEDTHRNPVPEPQAGPSSAIPQPSSPADKAPPRPMYSGKTLPKPAPVIMPETDSERPSSDEEMSRSSSPTRSLNANDSDFEGMQEDRMEADDGGLAERIETEELDVDVGDDVEPDNLEEDTSVPIEDVPQPSEPTVDASPPREPTFPVADAQDPDTSTASPTPVGIGDDEFEAEDLVAVDDADQELAMEMEAEEPDDSDDSEVDGLAQDADLPIEELLRRYGYAGQEVKETLDDDEEPQEEAPKGGPSDDEVDRDSISAPRKNSTTAVQVSPRSPLEAENLRNSAALSTSTPAHRTPSPTNDESSAADEEEPTQEAVEVGEGAEGEEEVEESEGSDVEQASSLQEGESGSESESDDEIDEETQIQVPPPFLLRGTLRPYQQAGLEWLASLHSNKTNGILADEMGLGKTIQTIALLGHLACSKGIWGPHLVIVPTSVLLNWEMEFKRFLPGFKTLSYYGHQKDRKEKRQGWTSPHAFNVCITSYQLAIADQAVFRRKKWVYMILDEAHNIKNFKSKRWETLLCFNAEHRLLLTGTPLQNNLMELWSLLYFLMPDEGFATDTEDAQLFVRRQDFKDLFQNPVERAIEAGNSMTVETKDTVQKLHTLLRPYLLRRLKSEVEKQLPSKHEHLVYCRLSKRQRFLYDEFMSRAATRETLASGNFLSIVNCLMQLRKVCNHPDLFEVRPIVTSFAMTRSAVADYEIKELLVRRRLLATSSDEDIDLATTGLQVTQYEPPSLLVARSTRRLDASSRFPYTIDVPGEPPPQDTRTIAGWKAHLEYQRTASNVAHWKHVAYVNRSRCQTPILYSSELLRAVGEIQKPLLPLHVAERDRRHYLDRVDATHALVKSYEDRFETISDVIDRFAFATPRVVSKDLPQHCLPVAAQALANAKRYDSSFDTLHRPAVKLQIAFPDASLIQFDCGKLQELDVLLRERAAGGHRVLIFTQMTRVLDILEIFLNFHGYRYLRLDGSTKIEQRQIITERFNVDNRIFAFIASSRSGGVGINLTGADTVIFYDSDYNPSMDRQCEDRAHRIGQTREVHIYRFISLHTVEEAMLRKANQKRSLDDMVIQKGEFDWRKMLADELEGGGRGKRLEEALALVEDQEDAVAAQKAAAEGQMDAKEFDEKSALGPLVDDDEILGGTAAAGAADDEPAPAPDTIGADAVDDPLAGTVEGYLIRTVEWDWDFFGFERPYSSR